MNPACMREWFLCAEWHVSCITTEVESEDVLILNSIRSFLNTICPVSSLAHNSGFICIPKWNFSVSFINLAIKGQGDDAILSFRNPKWSEIAVLGMRSEGTSENHVAIMDWQKFILSDQWQLHNKQKTFASLAHGLLPHHILCKMSNFESSLWTVKP